MEMWKNKTHISQIIRCTSSPGWYFPFVAIDCLYFSRKYQKTKKIVVTLKEFINLNFQVDVAQNVSEGANLFTLASVISKAKQ